MNGATAPFLTALIAQLGLGLAVFISNTQRKSNQCFLLLSLVALGWLGSIYGALITTDPGTAAVCIREAFTAAALIVVTLNLLRLSIRWRQESWWAILRRSWVWIVLTLGIVLLCQSSYFLVGAEIPEHVGGTLAQAKAVYGPGINIFTAYLALGFCRPRRWMLEGPQPNDRGRTRGTSSL